MKLVTGNLWTYVDPEADHIWRGITTNGVVRADGGLVMGRGCAREARDAFPGLDQLLGRTIRETGNRGYRLPATGLFTFPVKHHWRDAADPALIRASALQLKRWALDAPADIFVLPRPGCGNGRLSWPDVAPLLLDLPDNVHVITFEPAGTDARDTRATDAP